VPSPSCRSARASSAIRRACCSTRSRSLSSTRAAPTPSSPPHPPLLDVAWANLEHWRVATNLRYYEDLCCFPQPTIKGELAGGGISADGSTIKPEFKLGPGVLVQVTKDSEFLWTESPARRSRRSANRWRRRRTRSPSSARRSSPRRRAASRPPKRSASTRAPRIRTYRPLRRASRTASTRASSCTRSTSASRPTRRRPSRSTATSRCRRWIRRRCRSTSTRASRRASRRA
jgi:hypothetical protein